MTLGQSSTGRDLKQHVVWLGAVMLAGLPFYVYWSRQLLRVTPP